MRPEVNVNVSDIARELELDLNDQDQNGVIRNEEMEMEIHRGDLVNGNRNGNRNREGPGHPPWE